MFGIDGLSNMMARANKNACVCVCCVHMYGSLLLEYALGRPMGSNRVFERLSLLVSL
jgi:hypothetical protein